MKLIEGFYKMPAEEVKRFRAYGLDEKEMALVFILAHFKNQKPEIFVEQYKKQGSSWSQIAFNLGIEPAAAGKLIMAYPAKQILTHHGVIRVPDASPDEKRAEDG